MLVLPSQWFEIFRPEFGQERLSRLQVTVIGEIVIFRGRLKFQMDLMLAGVAEIFGKNAKDK